ncbi:DeoR/GlpR family DNA-binding transcription regulator [Paenibacillus piri]|uniref:Lactose phosphotransferase system repressor n=1 Tax=Paenibacillus piri TaxID=2547395 RepID=A0A4V6PIJ6_9BACL|nr:DeoR/GlpR family DNA-binding transcription regulator [Paenibacillus piri]TDF98844.1 DeoR/GlpR transcriptional regulator [Paenibacillus piri]
MLKEERHQVILELLHSEGKVVATELSIRLNVSEDTIRRDLRELDTLGLLHRVHGGALLQGPPIVNFEERHQQSPEAKLDIARTALQLVKNGQVIIIDGGTTTQKFAEQLPPQLSLTVVTNSPPIAATLASHPNVEVIMIGGRLLKGSIVNIGAGTIEALDQIRADLCILGVYSINPLIGSVPDQEEAFVKRKMISVSAETAALVTAQKLGTASSYVVTETSKLTYLVTERNVSQEHLLPYRKLGVTVL